VIVITPASVWVSISATEDLAAAASVESSG
jgi:hypothetical protein